LKYSSWRGDAQPDDVASDGELVVAFRDRGRDVAYGELVRRYQIPVFRLFLGFFGGGDEAEDACENAFFKGAKEIADLGEPEHFYKWLVARAQEQAVGAVSKGPTAIAQSSDQPRPPDAELREAVQAALIGLDPVERAVLILAELQQSSADEIAEAIDRPVDEVKALIAGARQRFVSRLQSGSSESKPRELTPLKPGAMIDDRFRIKGLLGRGGMGVVYLAEHVGLRREVAVKVMTEVGGDHEAELRERFRREALILGRLEHPNFVEVMDFGEMSDGRMFLALELLDGESLADLLDHGPVEPHAALTVLAHVLSGLEHLHSHGVVHRDIKPDNIILVEHDGDTLFAKILDLGIARLVTTSSLPEKDVTLTQARVVLGTPAYIAPEQAAGKGVDPRADLYSITVVLFEMLTGEMLYTASNAVMLMTKHLTATPRRLADVVPGLPQLDAIQELLDRGLAKRPAKRFRDATEYAKAVQRVLDQF
jgi:DNA-directed RNA polymerase specialized sigma24 family protein/predicted Ser/Thr protein kinase